jgi:hypothetical protein
MSISFYPLGIPFSSSFAVSSSLVTQIPTSGLPNSASIAEYVTTYIGPTGSAFQTVNVTRLL